MSNTQEYIDEYKKAIFRQGSQELLEWMKNTDFFSAPASSKFHSAYEGGLCDHSLNVYKAMINRYNNGAPDESMAICALLHDLCKAQFYKINYRNVKDDETGKWEKVQYYTIDDKFPYGHGEKSVFLIERFMKLKIDEAVAIRWHMGGFDEAVKGGSFSASSAYEKYPLAVMLHISDIEATYLIEGVQRK